MIVQRFNTLLGIVILLLGLTLPGEAVTFTNAVSVPPEDLKLLEQAFPGEIPKVLDLSRYPKTDPQFMQNMAAVKAHMPQDSMGTSQGKDYVLCDIPDPFSPNNTRVSYRVLDTSNNLSYEYSRLNGSLIAIEFYHGSSFPSAFQTVVAGTGTVGWIGVRKSCLDADLFNLNGTFSHYIRNGYAYNAEGRRLTADFEPYLRNLQKKVLRNWKPGNHRKQIYLVKVLYSIRRDGTLADLKIVKSINATPKQEQIALDAVRNAAPFEPLPEDYLKDTIDVDFTFDYNAHLRR